MIWESYLAFVNSSLLLKETQRKVIATSTFEDNMNIKWKNVYKAFITEYGS
jgi:high-affinity Fe2+/Pb2+ permease